MILQPKYKGLTPKVFTVTAPPTPGVKQAISNNILEDDQRVPTIYLEVDGTAADNYSETRTLAIEVPELKDTTEEGQTILRRIHGELPKGVEFGWATLATHTGEVTGGTDGITGETSPTWVTQEHDYQNPYYLPHDTVNEQVGLLKVQFRTTDAVPAYDVRDDRGHAGYVLMKFDVPYTAGDIRGVASATALETALSGQTFIYLRPSDGDPDNPYEWKKVGCLAPEVEMAYRREYSEIMKGYGMIVAGRSLRQFLADFNCNSTGDTEFLAAAMNAGNITQETGWGSTITKRANGNFDEFEVVLETVTKDGVIINVHIPRAHLDENGSITYGGAEKQIPFTVYGMETPKFHYSFNLYQSVWVAAGIKVVV